MVIQNELLIGGPLFGNYNNLSVQGPIGQIDLYRIPRENQLEQMEIFGFTPEKLGELPEPLQATFLQSVEYVSIIEALKTMGVPYRIAIGQEGMILPPVRELIEKVGGETVRLPCLCSRLLTYIRDVAVRVRDDLILVSSELEGKIDLPDEVEGCRIVFSSFGEGGRTVYHDGTVLVNDVLTDTVDNFPVRPEPDAKILDALKTGNFFRLDQIMKGVPATAEIEKLQSLGLKVGVLPVAMDQMIGSCRSLYMPTDHIDLVIGLVVGKDGILHLIVDPKPYHHFLGVRSRPLRIPEQTLDVYKRVCDELGIIMHVPEALSTPASMNFVQFEDGRVLMTDGDENVAQILDDIVQEVYTTPVPIRYIPSWCKAGIRCVTAQWPRSFTDALANVSYRAETERMYSAKELEKLMLGNQ